MNCCGDRPRELAAADDNGTIIGDCWDPGGPFSMTEDGGPGVICRKPVPP
jgi:hypothetical protein